MRGTTLAPRAVGKAPYLFASFVPAYESQAAELLSALREAGISVACGGDTDTLAGAGWLLLLIGKETPQEAALRDVTFALDHGAKIFCVLLDDTALEPGLTLQLGLAEKCVWDEETVDRLLHWLYVPEKKPSAWERYRRLFLIVAVAVIVLTVFLVMRSKAALLQTPVPAADEVMPSEPAIDMEAALLSALIENGLDTDNDGNITRSELAGVQVLDLSSRGITDIAPLSCCADMRELDLHDNEIKDISSLAAMAHLQKADLSGNCITDFQTLTFLPELTDLTIDGQKEVPK